jgi:virulence factor
MSTAAAPDQAAPVRVGLLGAGNIAQVAHLPALLDDGQVTIAGVVTGTPTSAERALRRWPIERAYDSPERLLDGARLDALVVATPRSAHAAAVRLALAADLPVLCEKPLAGSAAEAAELADLASRRRVGLQVGFNRRYAPGYVRAHAAFRDTGGPQFVLAQKNRPGSEYRATLENAIHMVDLLRWFAGDPPEATRVEAVAAGADRWQEDGVAALLTFPGGATGQLLAARTAGVWDERLDAYGHARTASVRAPDTVEWYGRDGAHRWSATPAFYGWASAGETMGFAPAVRAFLGHVRAGAPILADGRQAALTQALLEQILAAAGLPLADDPDRAQWRSRAVPDLAEA